MSLLLTGATGFVGSHVLEALHQHPDEVRLLVRPTSDLALLREANSRWKGYGLAMVEGHLGDKGSLGRACQGVRTIVHLAAMTRARNEKEFRIANEEGTRRLLESAQATPSCRRFIYVSSLAAVGPSSDGRPLEPTDPPRPLTAYGRSKLAGELALQNGAGKLELAILRPPAVYGPRDRDLLAFFKMATYGILPVPTGPPRSLQLIHVHDLARAIHSTILSRKTDGIYHLAEPRPYAWREVLNLMALAVGKAGREVPIPQTLFHLAGSFSGAVGKLTGRPQVFDSDKARELLAPAWLCETRRATEDLGFTASIPLEDGLRTTAAWYREEGWLR
jgi:nucleoside-diphosphate-sugar epimerase